MNRGSVVIADDDVGMRSLLSTLLADAGFETREAGTGPDALAAVRDDACALVILDVNLPGLSGYEVCHELKEEFGDRLPILFVSGERTESYDRAAGILIGGDDYLVKPLAADELLARVRSLIRRAPATPASAQETLTPRELEVLRLLAGGERLTEIAHRLVIAPKTVAKHVEHILAKLGVHSRAEAVAQAHREHLL